MTETIIKTAVPGDLEGMTETVTETETVLPDELKGKTETIIRAAVPRDLEGIVALGLEALNSSPYPNLVISKDKVYAMAIACISSANNFVWVAEKDGRIVASVGAIVHPIMFYEKKQASVVQYYSTEPGVGLKLIREFMKWVENRPVIKMVCFTLELNSDPRIPKLLSRLGLTCDLPVYFKIM